MPVPFGVNGPREEIRDKSLAGQPFASYSDGFPPITMLMKQAGGLPPHGKDMNQILFELASGQRWSNSGAGYKFNKAFSDAVGGYPKGAQLLSNDGTKVYVSTEDDNKTDFNTSPGADWVTLGDYIGLGNYATKTDVGLKLDKTAVVQIAGASTTDVPSQKLFTDAITNRVKVDDFNAAMEGKFNTSDVVSSTGNSTSRVMSQKSVTDALNGKQASGDYATNTDLNNTNDKLMGIGQKWVDVTSSRVNETLYTNTTKRPISVMVYGGVTDQIAVVSVDIFVDGVAAFKAAVGGSGVTKRVCASAIVPPGSIYRVVVQNSTIGQWCEMRG